MLYEYRDFCFEPACLKSHKILHGNPDLQALFCNTQIITAKVKVGRFLVLKFPTYHVKHEMLVNVAFSANLNHIGLALRLRNTLWVIHCTSTAKRIKCEACPFGNAQCTSELRYEQSSPAITAELIEGSDFDW